MLKYYTIIFRLITSILFGHDPRQLISTVLEWRLSKVLASRYITHTHANFFYIYILPIWNSRAYRVGEKASPTSKTEDERRKRSLAADTGWKVPSIFSNQHSITGDIREGAASFPRRKPRGQGGTMRGRKRSRSVGVYGSGMRGIARIASRRPDAILHY